MPAIEVSRFKGLYNKVDGIIDDPAFADNCRNIVIYEGDICNMPYLTKEIPGEIGFDERITFHYFNDNIFLVKINKEFVFLKRRGEFIDFVGSTGGSNYVDALPKQIIVFSNQTIGKLIQPGKWLIVTGLFGNYKEISDDGEVVLPLMFRMRHNFSTVAPESNIPRIMPLGLLPPRLLQRGFITSGNLNGDMAFAFSFVTLRDRITDFSDTILYGDDIESNVIEETNTVLYQNGKVNFRLFLPQDYISLPEGRFGFGIYSRLPEEGNFHLWKYVVSDKTIFNDLGTGSYLKLAIDETPTRDLTLVAPQAGTEESHDVPRPAFHADFFRGRMYYASLPAKFVSVRIDIETKNRLEISQTTSVTDNNIDRQISYILTHVLVGKDSERITGVINYGGQLIIFKETEIWVLTNDILEGGIIRLLFSNRGCISIGQNRAYLVADRKLFFLDQDGLYVWTGEGEPIRISDPIRTFLTSLRRKDYVVAHLSIDPRYNLLYLAFPSEEGYIYNYKENAWTVVDRSQSPLELVIENPRGLGRTEIILRGRDMTILKYGPRIKTGFLNAIDQDTSEDLKINWFWKTVKLNLGKQGKKKHWKFFRIESESELPQLDHNYIFPELISVLEIGLENHLGIHSKNLQIKFGQEGTKKAFRINGYELEAHLEGRR